MSSKVVPLFDPSRPRRERVPTERSQPSEVVPFPLDPSTAQQLIIDRVVSEGRALLAQLRESRSRFEAAMQAQVADTTQSSAGASARLADVPAGF
jgi:hypothetical protein